MQSYLLELAFTVCELLLPCQHCFVAVSTLFCCRDNSVLLILQQKLIAIEIVSRRCGNWAINKADAAASLLLDASAHRLSFNGERGHRETGAILWIPAPA